MPRWTQSLMALSILVVSLAHAQAIDYLKKGSAGDIRVSGEKRGGLQVFIRTVNDSDVLWTRGYRLGRKAWIGAGANKLTVMCEFKFRGGQNLVPGEIDFSAEKGKEYEVQVAPASAERKECDVRIAEA